VTELTHWLPSLLALVGATVGTVDFSGLRLERFE